ALARVHRGHPGWGHLDFPDFCARLSEASGLSPERIARALQKTSCANPREFTETIQTLEHLRKLP
ncbi:MAG TPA: hypothetical protein VN436_07300, partial [Holophaga sp.]|nr:hypothetical protein [Holophaga sp.]